MSTFRETGIEGVLDRTKDRNNQDLPITTQYQYGFTNNTELRWEPASFYGFGRIMRTTNKDLSLLIKEYYARTFHDIRGVFIGWDGRQFITSIYFSKNMEMKPDNKIENLVDISVAPKGQTSYYALRQALDNKVAGKRYTLNDETKLLLSDICFGGRQNAKPQNAKFWNAAIKEIWVPAGDIFYNPRAGQLVLSVSGCFDIHRILSKLFGRRMVVETSKVKDQQTGEIMDENKYSDAGFEARFIKPVLFNDPNVFIMHIEQFDKAAVEKFNATENPIRPLVSNGIVCF